MKIIAFNGSPRKGGNTEELLNAAIRGAASDSDKQDVRVFRLQDMDITGCLNCGECNETGICIVEDDFQEVADVIRKADRIIFASPVFFMGISAQAKALVDRCQSFWCEKFLLEREIPAGEAGRKGLVLMVGGMKSDKGINCAASQGVAFLRTVSVPESETLKYMGVDNMGDILKHPTAIKEAEEAGQRLAK
ncbi:MAG: flavodoxin family protein [Thermodesulfovibrionales bacterium]|nr:flavodoxin family protein [Thermodesulfovibrionales bacterium]